MKNFLRLNASLLYWVFVAPFQGQLFKIAPIFRQMVFIGVRATPMVALTAFSIGVTLAMQAAHSLQELGAEIYVPDLVMLSLLREMGPVLIAVIVIGRSGSAVAAELGTMKVSEEIEALEVMAINPISYLIVPRFIAMMIMLPALTILGNYIGVLGGWAVCHFALDVTTAGYIVRAIESAECLGSLFRHDQERGLCLGYYHNCLQRRFARRRRRGRGGSGDHFRGSAIAPRYAGLERNPDIDLLFQMSTMNPINFSRSIGQKYCPQISPMSADCLIASIKICVHLRNLRTLNFVIRASSFLGHSSFVIRHFHHA